MRKRLARVGFFVVVLGVLQHIAFHHYNPWLFKAYPHAHRSVIEVKPGATLQTIATYLEAEKIIPSAWWFMVAAFRFGWQESLKSGHYRIESLSPFALLERIQRGDSAKQVVTIVEGWKFADIVRRLKRTEHLAPSSVLDNPDALAARLGLSRDFLDGAFLPDTYYVDYQSSPVALLARAHRAQQRFLAHAKEAADPIYAFETDIEILALAALVEKEGVLRSEYPTISGVFHNRLIKNMYLQADPTVIYAAGDDYKGRIRYRHLRKQHPYNTYTTKGLTPYPIAYAGRAAITAALNPARNDYVFFVSKDGREHHFSVTLEEHNRAVDKYILNKEE